MVLLNDMQQPWFATLGALLGKTSAAGGESLPVDAPRRKRRARGVGAGQVQFVRCRRVRHEGERDAQPSDYFPPFIMLSL